MLIRFFQLFMMLCLNQLQDFSNNLKQFHASVLNNEQNNFVHHIFQIRNIIKTDWPMGRSNLGKAGIPETNDLPVHVYSVDSH